MSEKVADKELMIVGWREWVLLPELCLSPIKAKVDTGARTSALHAFDVRPFSEGGLQRVEFKTQPRQGDNDTVVVCTADVIDERPVTDSGGHKEQRWVIQTQLTVGNHSAPIEITLTSRHDMRFRMLLGRKALSGTACVNPAKSYLVGKKPKRARKGRE